MAFAHDNSSLSSDHDTNQFREFLMIIVFYHQTLY